jgi:cell division protein FtsL
MRTLCLLAFGIFVGLFAYTYNLKLKTRALEAEARELVNTLQDEGDFLALMRAEVSYLSRPERIEDMARKTLKLEPIASTQLVPWSGVAPAPGSTAATQTSSAPLARKDGIAALIEKASTQTAPAGVR